MATGAALILFALLVTARPKDDAHVLRGALLSAGVALAVLLSVLLRTANYGLDASLTPGGGWLGWGFGLLLGTALAQLDWSGKPHPQQAKSGLTLAVLGIFLILSLVFFAFSAPAVIARWTEGNYALIVIIVSLFAAGWGVFAFAYPGLLARLPKAWLVSWNLLFTLALTGTLLAHRVPFPATPEVRGGYGGRAERAATNPAGIDATTLSGHLPGRAYLFQAHPGCQPDAA